MLYAFFGTMASVHLLQKTVLGWAVGKNITMDVIIVTWTVPGNGLDQITWHAIFPL